MEDLQKIKEFFSKSLEETTFKKGDKVTYLGHPGEITGINKEMTGAITYNVAYDKGNGRTKVTNLSNKGGEIKLAEAEEKYTVAGHSVTLNKGTKSDGTDWTVTFKNGKSKPLSDVLALIKPMPKGITMNEAKLISDYKVGDVLNLKDGETWKVVKLTSNGGVLAAPFGKTKDSYISIAIEFPAHVLEKEVVSLNESKSEDKVDTITMDVPLFLRILEYSREDAQKDVDLHDVTDKAISLGKERGILSMEDYEEIVGTTEEIIKEYKNILHSDIMDLIYNSNSSHEEIINVLNSIVDEMSSSKRMRKNVEKRFRDEMNELKGKYMPQDKLEALDMWISDMLKYKKPEEVKQIILSKLKDNLKEGMGGQLDEPFFIEISVRDARKALDLFQDRYRNSNIDMYGSNVYAADTPEDIYDLYYDLMSQDIEVLDYNVEDEDFDYDSEYEDTLMEANIPSNIRDFAKRKGVSSLVNKVAGWAEKVGARIAGGTAVGKNYSTLVLDLDYKQQGEIRIDTDEETIELYDEPVLNFNQFQRVYMYGPNWERKDIEEAKNKSLDSETIKQIKDDIKGFPKYQKRGFESFKKEVREKYKITPKQLEDILHGDLKENVAPNHDGKAAPYGSGYKPLEERIAKALDQINEELCPAGKAYRKRRMEAGEKSSAYLSGRAVKVCKGQMSGKKKKK